jgi:hypothetical protein
VTTGETGRWLRVLKREVATRWDGSVTPEKIEKELVIRERKRKLKIIV